MAQLSLQVRHLPSPPQRGFVCGQRQGSTAGKLESHLVTRKTKYQQEQEALAKYHQEQAAKAQQEQEEHAKAALLLAQAQHEEAEKNKWLEAEQNLAE